MNQYFYHRCKHTMPFTVDYIESLNTAQLYFLHRRCEHYEAFTYNNQHAPLEEYKAGLRDMLIKHLDTLPNILRNELRLLNLLIKKYDAEQFHQLDFESRYYVLTYTAFKDCYHVRENDVVMQYIDEYMRDLFEVIWFIESIGCKD